MSDPSAPEDMRALLQTVERDMNRRSPNRDRIGRAVMAAFDEAVVSARRDQPVVVPLIALDDETEPSRLAPRAIRLAFMAAAVLLVVLAISGVRSTPDNAEPATHGIDSQRRLSVDGQELPAPLLPGRQTTDKIASGLSFDAPDGLAVVEEGEGQMVLAIVDRTPLDRDQLVIVETGLSDWIAELRALAEAGDVELKEIGLMVDGNARTRLDATVTDKAARERSCTTGEPCIWLKGWPSNGAAALYAGAENRVVEIGRTEDSVILSIELTRRSPGMFSLLAAKVVATSSLEEPNTDAEP